MGSVIKWVRDWDAMTEPSERDSQAHGNRVTSTGGGGGAGGGGVMDSATQAYIDRTMDTVRAQNDARFAEINTKLDKLPDTWKLVGIVAGGIAAVFGILAFAGDRFDGGMAAGSLEDGLAHRNAAAIEALATKDAAQAERLDALILLLGQQKPAGQ